MKLEVKGFAQEEPIPEKFAFCKPDASSHVAMSDNRNPEVRWRGVPNGTKSLVLLCVDPDVPSQPDDVNQEDREVPADLPRVDFFHWVMVDIPPNCDGIEEGGCADGVLPHGKQAPKGPQGSRQGINNYTDWFAGDKDMDGDYFGYDGPCPPWNDSIVHRYCFRLYATSLERADVEGKFRGEDVMAAIKGHVLDEAEYIGTYTLNPRLR